MSDPADQSVVHPFSLGTTDGSDQNGRFSWKTVKIGIIFIVALILVFVIGLIIGLILSRQR